MATEKPVQWKMTSFPEHGKTAYDRKGRPKWVFDNEGRLIAHFDYADEWGEELDDGGGATTERGEA